jgi:hypothetical protein
MKKLSVAVTLALSMGVASQAAYSEITLKPNGKGDALLFPVYNAYVDNYFTISNSENMWVQGHLRFRGAAWSGELLDFDILLSPGDVFVFRVADVDGDGYWEVDQSLDINNFKYTGKVSKCQNSDDEAEQDKCMDFGTSLVPTTRDAVITDAIVDHHLKVGYVEFIGEAVLRGLDYEKDMKPKMDSGGITAWSWSDAANQFAKDNKGPNGSPGLGDVPNALSGTAFITLPGVSHGLAYNAEALVNFRTGMNDHRIDNYRMFHDPKNNIYRPIDSDVQTIADNGAVIVHDERVDGPGLATVEKPRPYGDYVLRYENYRLPLVGTLEDRDDEARMSFQNTWGPGLIDGDDYELMGIRPTYGDAQDDDFDADWSLSPYAYGVDNSVAEVEEAIRKDGQIFTAYYFDDQDLSGSKVGLRSQYFAFYPTKVFWSEMYNRYGATNFNEYLDRAVRWLLSKPKPYNLEVWNNFELNACADLGREGGLVSPYVDKTVLKCPNGAPVNIQGTPCFIFLGYELTFLDIATVKSRFPCASGSDFPSGRVVFDTAKDANDPFKTDPILRTSWPALMYTFELGDDWSLSHWRSLQR